MRRLFLLFLATAVIVLLSACATARLDADFGTSYKLQKINQVLNPDAEKNVEPVAGMDGVAAKSNMDKYHAGFEEKKAAPAYSISVGNISTGQ